MNRYDRQTLLPQIGLDGQERLAQARVLLVGCGALGTVLADQLVRAGVGFLRLVDRDIVELHNLQRQTLFDEEDAKNGTPKAVAAAKKLSAANSKVRIDAIIADVDSASVEHLAEAGGEHQMDLVLDGTDNAETRFLINDVAVKHKIRWVYGGCVGTVGRVMAIDPGKSACLRCLFRDPPAAGELPTCSTAGVLGSASGIVASMQAIAAIKFLVRSDEPLKLDSFDAWSGRWRSAGISDARDPACPACAERRFEFLETRASGPRVLCGQNAVQFQGRNERAADLLRLADRLGRLGDVRASAQLLRFQPRDDRQVDLSIFSDGRVIVHGIGDVPQARTIYSRYLSG